MPPAQRSEISSSSMKLVGQAGGQFLTKSCKRRIIGLTMSIFPFLQLLISIIRSIEDYCTSFLGFGMPYLSIRFSADHAQLE
jgi:hypothetical protein